MALAGSASRRYAEALFDAAVGEKTVPAYRASLDKLSLGLATSFRALRDPSVPLRQRQAALARATEGEPAAIRSVLQLLLERDRVGLLPQIAAAFGDLVDRYLGVARAKISTAVALDDARRAQLVARLEKASGTKIRATFVVDPSLIGGAKVQIGDHLIDSSLAAQLQALRRSIV